ncbi:hypothetical protein ABIA30_000900 [Mycobacterium sp. MAA66]
MGSIMVAPPALSLGPAIGRVRWCALSVRVHQAGNPRLQHLGEQLGLPIIEADLTTPDQRCAPLDAENHCSP